MQPISKDLSQARLYHQAGNLPEAERLYRQVLLAAPAHAEAKSLLGLVMVQTGRCQEGLDQIQEAAQGSHDGLIHDRLGVAFASVGRHADALASFQQATRLTPDRAAFHYNLASAFEAVQCFDEAIDAFRRAIALDPDYVEARYNLANMFRDLGRPDEAIEQYRRALDRKPGFLKAQMNLGNVFRQQGQAAQAEGCYREVIRRKPSHALAHCNLGTLLAEEGRLDEAAVCLREALRLQNDLGAAHLALGQIHARQGKLDKALIDFQSAARMIEVPVEARLELGDALRSAGRVQEAVAWLTSLATEAPNSADVHFKLGRALETEGRFEQAAQSYREAIRCRMGYAKARYRLGAALVASGNVSAGMAALDGALRLQPDLAAAHLARAAAALRVGDFPLGWLELEWRRFLSGPPQSEPLPSWDGREMEGALLLRAEPELCDTLHFIRYAALSRQRCGRVVVECPADWAPLLSRAGGVDQVVVEGESRPACQAGAWLLSLPGVFGTTLGDVPAQVPYLRAATRLVEAWKKRLPQSGTLRVGLHWYEGSATAAQRSRSVPLRAFLPLAAVQGVQLFSLERGAGEIQLAELSGRLPIIDLGRELDEQAGTLMSAAAAVGCLDLVITSDGPLAHLAAALARPVWLLSPYAADWRWLVGREDSPWYPTLRLFRQSTPDSWDDVFARIATELKAFAE